MRRILFSSAFAIVLFAQASWFVVNPPDLSTFTWNNQLSASWATVNSLPVLSIPFHSSPAQWNSLTYPVPGSTYTITMVFCPSGATYGIWHFGITLQDAANKAENVMLNMYNAPGQVIIYQEGNASTYSGFENSIFTASLPVAQVRALRIVEDGTHRTFYYSADGGTVWAQQFQEASGSYLTPTKWGVVGINLQSGTVNATLYQLGATTP